MQVQAFLSYTSVERFYVCVVRRFTGTEEAKILASDGADGDQFGISVSISGDYAIIGTSREDFFSFVAGSAYIFKRNGATWTQEVILLPSDGADGDQFGISVSISGDYAIVGASPKDGIANEAGAASILQTLGVNEDTMQKTWGKSIAGKNVVDEPTRQKEIKKFAKTVFGDWRIKDKSDKKIDAMVVDHFLKESTLNPLSYSLFIYNGYVGLQLPPPKSYQ